MKVVIVGWDLVISLIRTVMAADVESKYDKDNPFLARLTENYLLNKEGTSKDTRHLVIDLSGSGLKYTCGDSLGVYPTHRMRYVREVLEVLGSTGDELITLPRTGQVMPLREAMANKVALAGPRKKFLLTLSKKVESKEEKALLADLLARENRKAMRKYLADREFIDLLEEFPTAKFSPQEFVGELRRLVPRLYSIASAQIRYPREAHLTVAVVRYETNNREREGVCSTYLADRIELNEPSVPVFVAKSPFGLPKDDSANMIMVGPGTGIAPFRAFLQERWVRKSTGRNWLIFGDQHAATDYLYGEEFEAMKAAGHIERIDLAWSRDQDYKIYVQDKMLEAGQTVWEWIRSGAYFFVCGDAKYMAKSVDAALHTIAREHGGMSRAEAVQYFRKMKRERRYQRDIY